MLSITLIQRAMIKATAHGPKSVPGKSTTCRIARTLQLYHSRGDYDGTLQSAQRCLHWANYEVEGFPFAKPISKRAANTVTTRDELRNLYVGFGCKDLREVSSFDIPEGTKAYFAQRALDVCGSSVRDNEFATLVSIGKDIEKNGSEAYE